MKPEEYRKEISDGNLYSYEWDGGVLFLRRKESRHLMTFLVRDTDSFPDVELPEDTVMEIQQKPTEKAVAFWTRNGFTPAFERIRMVRPPCNESPPYKADGASMVSSATIENYNDIRKLVWDSFDHSTGCIPNDEELRASIASGDIIIVEFEQPPVQPGAYLYQTALGGMLRVGEKPASVEIRQLAIRQDLRGKGLSHDLVTAFTARFAEKKQLVWVRDGYTPAIKTYKAAGFIPDGRRSVVLVRL